MPRRSPVGVLAAIGALAALLSVSSTAVGQDSMNIDGNVKVGRGGPPNVRLEVILTTTIGLEVSRVFTDEEGRFTFPSLRAGDYRVTVRAPRDGPYKDGSAELHISGRPGPQRVSVTVELDAADSSRAATKTGTVGVDEMQTSIPRAAKKLYDSGTRAAAKGKSEEAIELFRRALEIAPDYLFALNDLGAQLCKVDRLDDAVEVLRKATAIAPKAYSPRMNLSLALLSARKPADAETEITIALAARPDDPAALYVSGQIERALGHHDRAVDAFNRALLNSSGQLVLALIQLGALYEEAGDRPAAVQAYRTYLTAAANGPGAALARARLEALGESPPKP